MLIGAPPWQAGLSPSVIGYSRIVILLNVTCFEVADDDEDDDKDDEVDVDEDRRDGVDNSDGFSCFRIDPLFVLVIDSCAILVLLSVLLTPMLLVMISSPFPSLIDRVISERDVLQLFVVERVLLFIDDDDSVFLMIFFGI